MHDTVFTSVFVDSDNNVGGGIAGLVEFGVTVDLRPDICKTAVSPATCDLTNTSWRKTDTETWGDGVCSLL